MSREELLHIIEKISVLLALVSLPLGMFRYVGHWPVSLLISTINIGVYYERGCYLRCITSSLNVFASFYGWYQWKKGAENEEKKVKIEKTTIYTWSKIGVGGLVLFLLLTNSMLYIKNLDWLSKDNTGKEVMKLPYISAFMTTMVLIGQWLSAHKKMETYLFWAVFNLISIYYHWMIGSFFAIKYTVYFGLSLYGFFVWEQAYKKEREDLKKK